jgi:hypothetical protein
MAGTIFGLPLSQQFYSTGAPMSGALLYLYDAGTSTPATSYEDFGLTTGLELSHPIVADSSGRIPEFWLSDGSYRVRLTDAQGNEIFDKNSVTAIGASSGSGGGGSGSSVSDESIFQTGDIFWQPVSGTRTGWVRGNGRTIGNSASGATERANADTESLFAYFWNNFSNSLCAVSGGRGANAAADYAASKTIATLDMRDSAPIGASGMGNTSSGLISDTAATAVGATTATVAQANLPNVNFTHSLTAASHTHTAGSFAVGTTITNGTNVVHGTIASKDNGTGANMDALDAGSGTASTLSLASGAVSGTSGANAPAVSGTVSSGGSGTALSIITKGRVGTWYFRL